MIPEGNSNALRFDALLSRPQVSDKCIRLPQAAEKNAGQDGLWIKGNRTAS